MHNHNGFGAFRDEIFYEVRVDKVVFQSGFAQHRLQSSPTHCQDAGNIGVGRNDYFCIVCPAKHLLVGQKNHGERIQAIACRHTKPCSAVIGKGLAEAFVLLSEQIPSALYDSCHFCSEFRLETIVQSFQVEILDIVAG